MAKKTKTSRPLRQDQPYLEQGLFLKSLREAAGLTQLDISEAFGWTTPQFVSNWERGIIMLPPNRIKKLAGLYRIRKEIIIDEFVRHYRNALLKACA